jgi:hypothetical protein
MLTEYALIPDIFDSTSYDSSELCSVHLQYLNEALLEEALVRDLREGEWLAYLKNWVKQPQEYCPQRAKELLKKLVNQNRLRRVTSAMATQPKDCKDWCQEAIASHDDYSLNGVITSKSLAEEFKEIDLVASIERLSGKVWWQKRGPSVRLYKRTSDYLKHLQLVLSQANSIMLIDPYLDPTEPRYREFGQIIRAAQRLDVSPLIEIHRVEYNGSGSNRQNITPTEWECRFSQLSTILQSAGLNADIFIWDYFHDRFIISDLLGIKLSCGLDLSNNTNELTTWSRLSRLDRDDVQREFASNTTRHRLKHRFTVP